MCFRSRQEKSYLSVSYLCFRDVIQRSVTRPGNRTIVRTHVSFRAIGE